MTWRFDVSLVVEVGGRRMAGLTVVESYVVTVYVLICCWCCRLVVVESRKSLLYWYVDNMASAL